MKPALFKISASALALVAFSASPLWANASSDALEKIKTLLEDTGATVTVEAQTENGEDARWDNVVIYAEQDDDDAPTLHFAQIEARATDGGVAITLPNRIPTRADGKEVAELLLDGHSLFVTDKDGNSRVNFAARSLKMNGLEMEGGEFTASIDNIELVNLLEAGEVSRYTGNLRAGTLSYLIAPPPEERDDMFLMEGTARGLQANYMFDAVSSEEDMIGFVNGAYAFKMEVTQEGGEGKMEGNMDGLPLSIDFSDGPGKAQYGVENGALRIMMEGNDYKYNAASPMFPPAEITLDRVAMNLAAAAGKKGEEKPFTYKMAIEDLSVSDQIWGMFDPKGILPRDPALLNIDVTGNMIWETDVLGASADAIEAAFDGDMPPFNLADLTVNDITLRLAGALLEATGSASGKVPMTTGNANVSLKGGQGLLDALVEMGFVPEDEAMMARMMVSTVAKPGPDGDDHLVSEIELGEGGALTVNGMRMR